MAAQVSEESNDRTSASAEGEDKWTRGTRFHEELKRVGENMARIEGAGGRRILPTIMRAPHAFREHGQFGYEFRKDPVYMRLGLYNRGALLVPTAAETRRMEAAIAFVNTLNKRRVVLKLSPIDWHEMCARVVPSPARVRQLWVDAPSDMTDEDVRHLLAIDAVFMLCFFQLLGDKFPQVQALDWYEADLWMLQGIMQDCLLNLENQIPLVLIQNALALALEGEHREHAEHDRVYDPIVLRMLRVLRRARVINPSSDNDSSSMDSDDVDLVCAEDFHPEVHTLLSSVLEGVLGIVGLAGCYDNIVPRDVIVSSDHLLDLVYRVVAKKYRIADVEFCCNSIAEYNSIAVPRPGSNSTRSVGDDNPRPGCKKILGNVFLIPTTSKLRKAGITVKGLKDATIWDYKMEQGLFTDTLWIPKLDIWDCTPNSLRNLLLMEMTPQVSINDEWQPLMEYLGLLKQLVGTREDVDILCGNTNDYVILNMVGDAGIVAKVIHDLDGYCEYHGDSPRFVEFCKEVQRCYKRRRKRWLWQFVETYLNKPWKIASLLAAILLLVLTALQTVYSILSYRCSC